ncbi:hypothetical protein IAT38_004997 [Cryptococcus sp. DSM 104549]
MVKFDDGIETIAYDSSAPTAKGGLGWFSSLRDSSSGNTASAPRCSLVHVGVGDWELELGIQFGPKKPLMAIQEIGAKFFYVNSGQLD